MSENKKKLTLLDVDIPFTLCESKSTSLEDFWYELINKLTDIKIFFRDIIIGVKNIFYYLPIIWKDRYWDYSYTLDLLVHKLEQQKKGFIKNQITADTPQIVEQINEIIHKIHRYNNSFEYFEDENQDFLYQIKEEKDEYKKEELISKFITNSYEYENKCWNDIFDSLKKYMRNFWD